MKKIKFLLNDPNEDNRKDQLNPNNDAYWQSRGEDERPDNWEEIINEQNNDNE